MDRLALFIAILAGASIAGAAMIVVLSLNIYSWIWFAACGVLGLVLAWPVGRGIARRIKRNDPDWPPRRETRPR